MEDYTQTVLLNASSLLNDAAIISSSSLPQLVNKLENAARQLAQIERSLDPTSEEVIKFIVHLVQRFVSANETPRIARIIEKMLQAMGPNCKDFVEKRLEHEVLDMFQMPSLNSLKRVTVMMEQSKMVHQLMGNFLSNILQHLADIYLSLIRSPSQSLRDDHDRLYYTVKLSLHMFQVYPDLKRSLFHSAHGESECTAFDPGIQKFLATVISCLVSILTQKVFPREITMLAGTTVALLISSAPTPQIAVESFFHIWNAIKQVSPIHHFGSVLLENMAPVDPNDAYSHIAEAALLKSVVSGTSDCILCCTAMDSSEDMKNAKGQPFLLRIFPFVCNLCDLGADLKYLSYQLLSLWYKKVLSCASRFSQDIHLMTIDSSILQETLKRISVSWDSPVDGVAEYVADTYRTLLEFWWSEVSSGKSIYKEFANDQMMKVLQIPWYARSRYTPLTLLLPYIDTSKILQERESLKGELLLCMETSYLAALGTDVYAAFLQAIRNTCPEGQQQDRWKETWMECFVSGLTSNNSVLRNKVCAYWLPCLLKILPNCSHILLKYLQDYLQNRGNSHCSHFLFAWVTSCRHVRNHLELDLETLPECLLTETLLSEDEDTCVEALSLLCSTQKKAEPLGALEMKLLRKSLPYCLKVDSAPFRQQLTMSLRKLFVRVRDSCSTAIKRKLNADFVDASIKFIEWLYRFVMFNLFPGSCFQRRRTCLDIIQIWFETVIFMESDGAKKGKAQGPMDALLTYARGKEQWDFFLPCHQTCLLYCIVDGADEIQETALHILIKYFPWSPEKQRVIMKPDSDEAISADACNFLAATQLPLHLLTSGLDLCNSPKAYENQSGALLVQLVYKKFVQEQGFLFLLSKDDPSAKLTVTLSNEQDACRVYFNILIQLITSALTVAKTNPLFASRNQPVHGHLLALSQCLLLEQSIPRKIASKELLQVLHKAVQLSTNTIDLMLTLLAGGQEDNSGICPSFAQMGIALENLLAGEGQSEQEVTSSLSPDFQLLLSWCWLNLKESCACLGVIVQTAVNHGSSSDLRIEADKIEHIGSTFLKVLTNCRHRGAIEGCRSGFYQFCLALMSSDNSALSTIAAKILEQLLLNLESDGLTSSVTRRSAGLPIIVQSVLQAERRCKNNTLLHQCVSRLYTIASCPVHQEGSQTQDQAPVHALNVLKSIFSDASLAGELLPHVGNMTQLVIQCFESSSWAMRNAATQLVSTLVIRMFGQRSKTYHNCNSMTLQEFSAHFPELVNFIVCKLRACSSHGNSITGVQPSLFLVLTLLASLSPSSEFHSSHSLADDLHEKLRATLSSPVYYLRELSATALAALTPLCDTKNCMRELLKWLQNFEIEQLSSNSIHGTLLCLDKLFISRIISPILASEVVHFMLKNSWLLMSAHLCPLIRTKSVHILHKAVTSLEKSSPLRKQLLEMILGVIFGFSQLEAQKVGQALLTSAFVSLVFYLLFVKKSHTTDMLDFCIRCLHSHDDEMRVAVLVCLSNEKEILKETFNFRMLDALWNSLTMETNVQCILSIADIFVSIHMHQFQREQIDLGFNLQTYLNFILVKSKFQHLASVQAALFPVEAVVLTHLGNSDTVCPEWISAACDWSDCLQTYSQPSQNENFRLAAAKGLLLVGQCILKQYHHTAGLDSAVVRLVDSCLILLEETDVDIRKVAARFVSSLQWDKKSPQISSMNSNLCCKVILTYACQELGTAPAMFQYLLSKLYVPGDLSKCLRRLSMPRTQHLFEHEDNTFFSEKVLQQMNIFDSLMAISADAFSSSSTMSPVLINLIQELKDCISFFSDRISDLPVYNLSSDARLTESLSGLILQAKILCQINIESSKASDCLRNELENLLKIKNINPQLSAFL